MKITFFFFLLLFSFRSFCQYDAIKPKGIYSSNFVIDEKPRTITYYMPATYGKQEAYPLLLILHGEKSNAAALIKKYGDMIQAKADSAGCIVLYPDAYKGHWNSDPKDSVNDVGFINIMADFFARQFNCDVSELKVVGIGSGGNLSYRVNCESIYQPVVIATINATAGNNSFSNCRNNKAIPNINITSTAITKAEIQRALDYLFTQIKAK